MNKINLPDNWSQVSISQFMEISSLDKDLDNYSLMVASILSNVDSEEIRKYNTDSYNRIMSHLSWTNTLPVDGNWKPILEIDGEKYGFINKLSDLSLGEWVDLENYIDNYSNNIHKVTAILYRPLITALNDNFRIVEDYDSNTMELRAEFFKDKVNIDDVYGSLVFFSIIAKMCTSNLSHYFLVRSQMEIEMRKSGGNLSRRKRRELGRKLMKEQEKKNGLGTLLFTDWQRAILQKLSPSAS